jgi:hypothetical protein
LNVESSGDFLAELRDIMYVESLAWTQPNGWQPQTIRQLRPDLVLYFGSREMLTDGARYQELRTFFPKACLMGWCVE